MSNIDTPNVPSIPAGTYRARAVEAALGETKGGEAQVGVSFEILNENYVGQQLTWYGYFHGKDAAKAAKRTMESLRYCGWKGDDLTDLSGIDANEVSIVVEHDTYNGVTRAKVKWVNRAGGLALAAPMPADKAKAFALKMRGLAMSVKTPEAPTPQPYRETAPSASGIEDSDIPF